MSVHYKFKSALDYDTVTFDGLHISIRDLKAAISQQKRIGKTSDFDLQITNAQTKEVYLDDNTLIPKNTSLLVARVPHTQQPKKQWEGSNSNQSALHKDVAVNKGVADLSRMEGSEQDKINAMISQSTFDYDPSNYQKIRGQNQRGIVPSSYTCYKCQKAGHWIKDCPTATLTDNKVEIRRSTGIPRSFMVPVDGPKAPGAMMTPGGTFAVPAVDRDAYIASECAGDGEAAGATPAAPDAAVPDELVCSLCRDLLTDAVMIPCCGNSFCDECIRGALLESEDHECPDCREKEIAPTTLIPNRFLRNSVSAFRNQTGYSRRMPHRQRAAPIQTLPIEAPAASGPPNGPNQRVVNNSDSGVVGGQGDESDGSADDNITVMVPPARTHQPPTGPHGLHGPRATHGIQPRVRLANMHRHPRYGPPSILKPPGIDIPPNMPLNMPRLDEQRSSTPTIDERRDPMSAQAGYNRGPAPPFMPGDRPPLQRFNPTLSRRGPPPGGARPPFSERFPPEPFQPPPPGIKDSPISRPGEDPLEAFNRMIREKEMRAKRREEERRRGHSGSPRSRSRSPRSPRSPRSQRSPRSPRSQRSPRSPRSQRSPRSPPRSPRARPRSRASSRPRYSRSRSMSRGRVRRSPWSPRRRRTRERTLSLTRSPSPHRRHRSPMRYRSPLRSPPPRSPPRSPLRSPPPRSLPRSPLRSPLRSPPRSPHRIGRSPPRPLSPHRYAGVYDELLSPPRRSVEPPYGARYGPRNNIPPPSYPPMGPKPIPPMGNIPVQIEPPPPGYRGRFDGPPFDDIPPGAEPAVPGFEPSPFEKPSFGPPGHMERDRLPPPNYRDPYRAPFVDGPPGPAYRDMPGPLVPNEIPVHVGEPPRFRDNYRPGHPYRDQGPMPFREPGPQPPYRDGPQPPYREGPQPPRDFRGGPPNYRDGAFRNHHPYREGGFRENPPHNFREPGVPFRPPSTDVREPVPPNYHDPNYRDGFREDPGRDHNMRPGYRPNPRSRGVSRRNPLEHERHREREGRDRERYNEHRDTSERIDKPRDDKRSYEKGRDGRDERSREYERGREYEKEREREIDRATPDKKVRLSPKRSRETREKKRSESRGRSRDRDGRREKKDERAREKTSADRSRERKEKEKKEKPKERKKKKREKEKDSEKKKKREKKERKEKETIKKEDDDTEITGTKDGEVKEPDATEAGNQVTVKSENINTEEIAVKKEKSPETETKNPPTDDLYGDEAAEAVDKEIIQNYVKTEENNMPTETKTTITSKEEPFDGIELQPTAEDLELKAEVEGAHQNKEMLALLPELSKWEVDDDNAEKLREPGEITSPEEEEDEGKVTSEVLKRAENAIFAKAISSLRPIEIKKISSDRLKLYTDETQPKSSIQITVPATDAEHRSIEINDKKKRYSKTPPPRLSVKERLGGKVEDVRRPRDTRVVHSTVERVKSRSKTPKKDQPLRRVTVEGDRGSKPDGHNRIDMSKGDRRVVTEGMKTEKYPDRSAGKEIKRKDFEKNSRNENKSISFHHEPRNRGPEKNGTADKKADRERKKSTLDEAHFEPDYDENVESENEAKEESGKKRSASPTGPTEIKKSKIENDTIKLDLTNVKKKPDSDSESSSSEGTSSSSSSEARKRKKKKKRSKKKKKRALSDSDSDSGSSSDDHKKKKKKRKHKKKSSKKKKKSKHK